MWNEKDGVLEEGVQVSITTVHRWRKKLSWSLKHTKYCHIGRPTLRKNHWSHLINHHSVDQSVSRSVGRSVGQLVGRSTPLNWPVFYEKYHRKVCVRRVLRMYRWELYILYTVYVCTDGRCTYCTRYTYVQMGVVHTVHGIRMYRWELYILYTVYVCTDGRCKNCTVITESCTVPVYAHTQCAQTDYVPTYTHMYIYPVKLFKVNYCPTQTTL